MISTSDDSLDVSLVEDKCVGLTLVIRRTSKVVQRSRILPPTPLGRGRPICPIVTRYELPHCEVLPGIAIRPLELVDPAVCIEDTRLE